MKKNKKIKRKLKRKFKIILESILILFFIVLLYNIFNKKQYVSKIEFKDDKLVVEVLENNISCILSSNTPTLNDKWIIAKDNKCYLEYHSNSSLFIKYNNDIINISKNNINFIDIEDKNKLYLSPNNQYNYIKVFIGDTNKLKIKNLNKDVAYLDNNGNIITNNVGNSKIIIEYNDIIKEISIIVSDLITQIPVSFNHDKEYIKCNQFTKDENDILDSILKSRINDKGYKTRAGAVEAARFLTLEFPYKISYFHENGRLTTNGIDAEGRYYHVGLYLNESRLSSISKSTTKPILWGCDIKSVTRGYIGSNGLDCSGFVSWTLLNAGYDIKDIGAGFKDGPLNDLTDYGEIKKLNNKLDASIIKVGDLLHSEHSGGHIAMIVGINKEKYYVAQALWEGAPTSLTKRKKDTHYVQITEYSINEMINVFGEVILMDKYYKEDGNLTNMW